MAMAATIIAFLLIMLLLFLLVLLLLCKPWRFFSRSYPAHPIKVDDLERPLVQEEIDKLSGSRNDVKGQVSEGDQFETAGNFNLLVSDSLLRKQAGSSTGDSLHIDIDSSEDLTGQTLKGPSEAAHSIEEQKHVVKGNLINDSRFRLDDTSYQGTINRTKPGSSLTLEVIAGPSQGLSYSVQSTNTTKLPLTVGRVSPSDLLLRDSEVSGKHAMINWNLHKLKWELVDMGSLNGTLVNSKAINHPDTGSRHWGDPVELACGDLITLGTTSRIRVHITSLAEYTIPFGVGVASDPMALRRGGKALPMEDVFYYQWPLPGADQVELQKVGISQASREHLLSRGLVVHNLLVSRDKGMFGIFGVCDGHGGADAAKSASKLFPEMVASILSEPSKRELVLSQQDASDILRDVFSRVEDGLNHHYEGCTATLLLVWIDSHKRFFLQCANVGDSTCVVNVNGKQIKMTEDHRITSYSERQRINETGKPLKDGDKRLCGLNLGRMLGDKFLKEQEMRFSSKPYVSSAVCVDEADEAFALMASDGLWDVLSTRKAIQLVMEAKERYGDSSDVKDRAEKVASFLLNEARALRTKDNTSVVYLDFDSASRTLCEHGS